MKKNFDSYYWYFVSAFVLAILTVIASYKCIFARNDILFVVAFVIIIAAIPTVCHLARKGINKFNEKDKK